MVENGQKYFMVTRFLNKFTCFENYLEVIETTDATF